MSRRFIAARGMMLVACFVSAACGRPRPTTAPTPGPTAQARPIHSVVPVPSSIQITPADTFTIDSTTTVVVASGSGPEVDRIAAYTTVMLRGPLGTPPRTLGAGEAAPPGNAARARSVHSLFLPSICLSEGVPTASQG